MSGNTFGTLFRLTSYGESHGKSVGGIIDGCPAGISVDMDFIQNELDRRKPGQSKITTGRRETDTVEFHSGIFDGKTLGTPIAFSVKNKDAKSADYNNLKDIFRPSHADYTYFAKYGQRDHRGGGRSSARETIARVVAGALAKLLLAKTGIQIFAYSSQIADIKIDKEYHKIKPEKIDSNIVRCPDNRTAKRMIKRIEEVKEAGDTVGGIITCVAKNVPAGLGEPVFDKLHAQLAKAIMSINAVKGFEYGSGFAAASMNGSEHNDIFQESKDNEIRTKTNFSGGIQGGISNGEDIYFNVAFKPVATLLKEQPTVNTHGEKTAVNPKGRHDPCVLPRAVPIVEAMTAMVLADFYLLQTIQNNI